MTVFEIKSTGRWYDIDQLAARILLRDDLERMGFFAQLDFIRFYPRFSMTSINFDLLYELLLFITFFDYSMLPSNEKRIH